MICEDKVNAIRTRFFDNKLTDEDVLKLLQAAELCLDLQEEVDMKNRLINRLIEQKRAVMEQALNRKG